MTLREREDRIFDKYRAQGETRIIPDGAISEEYRSARTRLLVILKEPNDPSGNPKWDLRDFGAEGERSATWSNLARWSALVQNPTLRFEQVDVSEPETRRQHLCRIAVVNLKKAGGGSVAVMHEIEQFARCHWALLTEQFKLYNPHLTITGGTFGILRCLLGVTPNRFTGSHYSYFRHPDMGICLDFYHPQQKTYKNELLFDDLKRELVRHEFSVPET